MPTSSHDFRELRRRRRLFLFSLWSLLMLLGLGGAIPILAKGGWTVIDLLLLGLFLLLLSQLAFGFLIACVGYWVLKQGGDPLRINNSIPLNASSLILPSTAIVMPVFNEDTQRVFEGLRSMFESLHKTGHSGAFDFFVLSDSNDPNCWMAEELAWLQLCKQKQAFGRIFYRKRRLALHHKSGNIADFCRRWGANYRYMIVLDADSIMTGAVLVRLVNLMEQNPAAGIIQTNPRSVLGETLFQRVFQFAGHAYGPMFMAGAAYWQLNEANFWGHNAIIRLRPFMEFCAMPELPQTDALGTRILSHDTIEAVLMRRAGYGVWFADDLEGSYEEGPPDLLASLQRDRRWCFGNLQHIWFLFVRGLRMSSRLHIWIGIMGYLSSPLWLLSLLLGTIHVVNAPSGLGVVPTSAKWCSVLLLGFVFILLFLPKFLGVSRLFGSSPRIRQFGGRTRILLSTFGEIFFSILLAPILMLFYTRFVAAPFIGRRACWGRQKRDARRQPSWGEWISLHGIHTILALAWGGWIFCLAPGFLPWMLPVLLGPLLAIPFSRLTASSRAGEKARNNRWFLIPEEAAAPLELSRLESPAALPKPGAFRGPERRADEGVIQAVLDPWVNAIHLSLLRRRAVPSVRAREHLAHLSERLLHDGPAALTAQEKMALLWDADALAALHQKVWSGHGVNLHSIWRETFQRYREMSRSEHGTQAARVYRD